MPTWKAFTAKEARVARCSPGRLGTGARMSAAREKNNLATHQWLDPTAEAFHSAFHSMEKAKGRHERHSREEIEQLLESNLS